MCMCAEYSCFNVFHNNLALVKVAPGKGKHINTGERATATTRVTTMTTGVTSTTTFNKLELFMEKLKNDSESRTYCP